jgi:hypothetical protein
MSTSGLVLAAALAFAPTHSAAARAVEFSAAAVFVVFLGVLVACRHASRSKAVELISLGGEAMPLDVVARQRRRLLKRRRRERIAARYEIVARRARNPRSPHGPTPYASATW